MAMQYGSIAVINVNPRSVKANQSPEVTMQRYCTWPSAASCVNHIVSFVRRTLSIQIGFLIASCMCHIHNVILCPIRAEVIFKRAAISFAAKT